MEIKETLNKGLSRAYTITLTADELAKKVDVKLAEAAPNVAIKGFRKGKVPMAHLKKMFGKSVLGEALQETIDGAVNEHLETSGNRAAVRPDIKMVNENWEEGQDVEVTVTYDCLPEVPDVDFSKVKLDKILVEVSDAAVKESLDNLAQSTKSFKARKATSKSKDGDQVVIDFSGSIDGVDFDGGKGEKYPLTLGSNSFIPGFEAQLIGVKTGDTLDVKVTFPAEYGAANLAGKDAVFAVTVHEVKEPVAAEIDDELAKKYGAESLDALKGQITTRLNEEYADAARAILKRRLMDALDGVVTFEIPQSLANAEASQIAHQLWHEDNPDVHHHNHDHFEPTAEHVKLAERRVRLGLLLAEVGNKNEIKINENEMRDAIMKQAQQYGNQAGQFLKYLQENPQMQDQIRAPLFEDKVVDFILAKAQVTEKSITKAELEKEIEKLDEI